MKSSLNLRESQQLGRDKCRQPNSCWVLLVLFLLVMVVPQQRASSPADGAAQKIDADVLAAADVRQRGRLEQGSCRNSSPLCIAAVVEKGLPTGFGNRPKYLDILVGMLRCLSVNVCFASLVSANPKAFEPFVKRRQVQAPAGQLDLD
jgi:hypothetical protein